jgi:integrase
MRGHITRRGNNTFSLVLALGRDPDTGKYQQKWITFKGNKQQAQVELTRLVAEFDRGVEPAPGKLTVDEWLRRWLRDVVAVRNRPRTVESYASLVRNHLSPALGRRKLHQLRPSDVDHMVASMRAKGLTANTALHAFTVLRKALRDAEQRGLVTRNVCRIADSPKVDKYKVDPPEMEAVNRILNEADRTEFGPILRFMAVTGIRRSEAIGLRWTNLDLDQSLVSIVATAQRLRGKGVVFQPTKTASSRRGIALDPATVKVLRRHRASQAERVLAFGGGYIDPDLVFADAIGAIIDPDRLSKAFRAIAIRAGYIDVNLHQLRHAHAAGLIRAGVHPRVVQDRLGHANAAFTMNVYGHASAGLQEQAARDFAALLDAAH